MPGPGRISRNTDGAITGTGVDFAACFKHHAECARSRMRGRALETALFADLTLLRLSRHLPIPVALPGSDARGHRNASDARRM